MKIAKKANIKINQVSSSCKALEYQLLDKRIHGAVIEVNGRYPDSGYTRNEVCTELAYIVSGKGILGGRNSEIEFVEGDQLVIEPGEDFFWEAEATIFMPCAPAWYPEQHKQNEEFAS